MVWAWALVPETAGVSLEEIDALFRSEAGREDAVLRQEVRISTDVRYVSPVTDMHSVPAPDTMLGIWASLWKQAVRDVGLDALIRELSGAEPSEEEEETEAEAAAAAA